MSLNNNYKVEEFLIPNDKGEYDKRWFITKNHLPVYEANVFLEEKSLIKQTTGRKYAYSLVKYLCYLDMIGVSYQEARVVNVKNYLKWLIYGDSDNLKIKSLESTVSHSTVSGDITVITEFYKHLKDEQDEDVSMTLKKVKARNKHSFLYGQVYEYDYSKIIDKHITNLKPSKEYIKWYSEEEKAAIFCNLPTLRDKAIFLLTLEGMRIDEALSVNLSDFDDIENSIQPSRSKGKESATDDENNLRVIALPSESAEVLNRYILTERADAENESGMYSDWLFINIRKGANQGKVVSYHNFLKILKTAAKRAGLNSKKIRTHSGRSTKVNELLEHQAQYPEDNITDFMIKELMGWKSMDSVEPYKNHSNKTIAKSASEKVHKRRKDKE